MVTDMESDKELQKWWTLAVNTHVAEWKQETRRKTASSNTDMCSQLEQTLRINNTQTNFPLQESETLHYFSNVMNQVLWSVVNHSHQCSPQNFKSNWCKFISTFFGMLIHPLLEENSNVE